MNIHDKTIVITGGASGLGAATARFLVREKGARVVLLDVNDEAGHTMVDEIGEEKALFVHTDVTDETSVRQALERAAAVFGGVHVCINCAGVATPCKVLSRDGAAVALEKFIKVVQINLIGLFNVMSKCAEFMAKNEPKNNEERGVVINISSGAAYEGQIGQCAYGASKSGVLGLNMPAARELGAHGIRVNAIAPGLFHTPMVDSLDKKVVDSLLEMMEAPKRMGDMNEFAHTCAYIIENAYLNAHTIRLDAASRMRAR